VNESEREAARRKKFDRIRSAMSNAGRERTLTRFGHASIALSLATYAIAAWLFFLPIPYALAVGAAGAATLGWLVLMRILSTQGIGSDYFAPMLLGGTLLLRALMDVELVEPVELAIPSAVLGLIVALGSGAGRAGFSWLLASVLFAAVSIGGLLALSNAAFDTWKADSFVVRVDSKRITGGGYRTPPTYELHLAPAAQLAAIDVTRVNVNKTLYAQTRIGDRLCFSIHRGLLRMSWYAARPMSACPAK
jgi:hypothetical protein